ncbi:hypothetical protein ACQJBY_032701 [Aegilops geniculata]
MAGQARSLLPAWRLPSTSTMPASTAASRWFCSAARRAQDRLHDVLFFPFVFFFPDQSIRQVPLLPLHPLLHARSQRARHEDLLPRRRLLRLQAGQEPDRPKADEIVFLYDLFFPVFSASRTPAICGSPSRLSLLLRPPCQRIRAPLAGADDASAGDTTELKWEFDEELGRYYVAFPDDQ